MVEFRSWWAREARWVPVPVASNCRRHPVGTGNLARCNGPVIRDTPPRLWELRPHSLRTWHFLRFIGNTFSLPPPPLLPTRLHLCPRTQKSTFHMLGILSCRRSRHLQKSEVSLSLSSSEIELSFAGNSELSKILSSSEIELSFAGNSELLKILSSSEMKLSFTTNSALFSSEIQDFHLLGILSYRRSCLLQKSILF